MVGYYPKPLEGELLYSATARLAAAIFPGRSVPYCAERLLGNAGSTFGVLLPNNVTKLMENVPEISGLTEEVVLNASVFHLVSPFCTEDELAELRHSVFLPSSTQGRRTFNARGVPTVLKYCVDCARRDAETGKPAIWRTAQNYYGSVACAEHGCVLQVSFALVRKNTLCAPAEWINLGNTAQPATAAEVAIARDFEWIHAQRSSLAPGFKVVVMGLRDALLSHSEFAMGRGLLNNVRLLKAAQDSLSPSSQLIFAPQFRQLARGQGLSTVSRTMLHAYCLYAYLGGTSLRQVLTPSARPPARNFGEVFPSTNDNRLSFFKERIVGFIRNHPDCTRSQISEALENAVAIVRSADREWFERHVPASQSHKPGRHVDRNWNNRDDKLCANIAKFVTHNGSVPFRSFRDALKKLNQPKGLLIKAKGRLPKTHALLASLIEPKQIAA